MSITRERLNSLAMQVWEESESECDTRTGRQLITDFAHALLKAVEAEMEVVGYREGDPEGIWFIAYTPNSNAPQQPLIALPLVKEE